MKLFYLIVFFNCLINISVAKSRCAGQCEKSPRKPVCAIMPNGKSKTFMNKCAMEQQACLKYVGAQRRMSFYSQQLFTELEFGHKIFITGKLVPQSKRLEISLSREKENIQCPLHISLRFPENIVIRNARINNNWGVEEKNIGFNNVRNPFSAGGNFMISIMVGVNSFHIGFNNHHYCDFQFRLPKTDARFITVDKDILMLSQVDHRTLFPISYPQIQANKSSFAFSSDVPKEFSPGNVLVLKGTPVANARGGFAFAFLIGKTQREAFQFSVRFSNNIVVRNHSADGKFNPQLEDRSGGFPFQFNRQFTVAIGFSTNEFRVAVNGTFFCRFNYPVDIKKIMGLKVIESDGMNLYIKEIGYQFLDPNLRGLENLSRN